MKSKFHQVIRGVNMGKIYTTYGKYYKKLKKGTGRFSNMYLWREMKKIFCFYVPTKNEFWLNDYGFERV